MSCCMFYEYDIEAAWPGAQVYRTAHITKKLGWEPWRIVLYCTRIKARTEKNNWHGCEQDSLGAED